MVKLPVSFALKCNLFIAGAKIKCLRKALNTTVLCPVPVTNKSISNSFCTLILKCLSEQDFNIQKL